MASDQATLGLAPDRRIKPKSPEPEEGSQTKATTCGRGAEAQVQQAAAQRSPGELSIELWPSGIAASFYFGSTWSVPGSQSNAPTFEARLLGWSTLEIVASTWRTSPHRGVVDDAHGADFRRVPEVGEGCGRSPYWGLESVMRHLVNLYPAGLERIAAAGSAAGRTSPRHAGVP